MYVVYKKITGIEVINFRLVKIKGLPNLNVYKINLDVYFSENYIVCNFILNVLNIHKIYKKKYMESFKIKS